MSTCPSKSRGIPQANEHGRAPAFSHDYFPKQNYHRDGPYNKILEQVRKALSTKRSSGDVSDTVVLDLASGPGEPAAMIARELPDVTVYSTDISEAMHATAVQKAKDYSNFHARIADMQDLTLFEDDSIDVVTSCYGYMFPPDKIKALRETLRVLKPGGTLIATTWNRVEYFEFFDKVISAILSEDYVGSPPFDPLSLREVGLFERMLDEAGFEKDSIEASTSHYPMDLSNDPNFHLRMMLMYDAGKGLGPIDHGRIKSTFAELAKEHLEVQDDGLVVTHQNEYKFVVAKKKKEDT